MPLCDSNARMHEAPSVALFLDVWRTGCGISLLAHQLLGSFPAASHEHPVNHLVQISGLEEERDQLQESMEKLEKQLESSTDQNQALKRENEELRQQLGMEVISNLNVQGHMPKLGQ